MANEAIINGNVLLDGDSKLTLGNGSQVNGSITGSSEIDAAGQLVIRENAEVVSNGNIGGDLVNFKSVTLEDGSKFDLSTNGNSINAIEVVIGDEAILTIGASTLGVGQILGSGFQKGRVVFADDNGLGGNIYSFDQNIGGEFATALETITINEGKTVSTQGSNIYSKEVILENGATLNANALINGGKTAPEEAVQNTAIKLGDNSTLKISNGSSINATINGVADNQGRFEILNGTLETSGDIGSAHNLSQTYLRSESSLNLATNNNILKSESIYLENNSILTIGSNGVVGNIYGFSEIGSSQGFGQVIFAGANNILDGNVGGSNDNALANVTVNSSINIESRGFAINAQTITLESGSTLTTSGRISGGSDVDGIIPINTAITLKNFASLSLNEGAQVYGSIDGSSAETATGNVEIAANYTSFGNLGANFKLESVSLRDGVNLNLATNNNSLNAGILSIGNGSTLSIGLGSVNAAIVSSTENTGSLYIDSSTNINSGSTLGGFKGLLAVYVDNAATGNVVVNSSDSIKALNVNITGANSALNLAENQTITGNVNLGANAKLNLANNSAVIGKIDGISNSTGALEISGEVVTQGNIGNSQRIIDEVTTNYTLASVTLAENSTLNLATNNNILKSNLVTLGADSTLRVGNGAIVGQFLGAVDGDGNITFTTDNTIAAGTRIGFVGNEETLPNHIGLVTINTATTLTLNESMAANNINVNGTLLVADNMSISGSAITVGGVLTVNDHVQITSAIKGSDNSGEFIVNEGDSFTAHNYIGGADIDGLGLITLKANSNLNLNTNNQGAHAENIILYSGSSLDIGTASVNGVIKGLANGNGSVTFNGNNNLVSSLGADGFALSDVTIAASLVGNSVDSQGNAIYANEINLENNAKLTSSAAISAGNEVAAAVKLSANSTLTLEGGASILGLVNAVSSDENGLGTVEIASGSAVLNGDIGNNFKINKIEIAAGATFSVNSGLETANVNATSILIDEGSAFSFTNNTANDGDFGLSGVVSGSGSVNLANSAANGTGKTYQLYATLGAGETALDEVNFNIDASTMVLNNSIKANSVNLSAQNSAPSTVFSVLSLAEDKNISGDVILTNNNGYALLNLKDGSSVSGEIKGSAPENGYLMIGNLFAGSDEALSVTAQNTIGGDGNILKGIIVSGNTTFDLATNEVDASTYEFTLGNSAILAIGGGSATSTGNISIDANSSITVGSGSLTAPHVIMSAGSSIVVGGGNLSANVIGGGDVTFNADNSLRGKIGVTSDDNILQVNSLSVTNSATLAAGSYEIAATSVNIANGATLNSSGKISGGLDGASALTADITLNENSSLGLNSTRSINANINGVGGFGAVNISGDVAGNINIGNAAKIAALNLNDDSSLDLATNNNALNASSVTLASNTTLSLGNITIEGKINGNNNNRGNLVISTQKTVTTNGNIGAEKSLHQVDINADATLNLAANNNSLNAATTNIAAGANLIVGSGEILGSFVGATSGDGKISFAADNTVSSAVAIGTSQKLLDNVEVQNGASVTLNNLFFAEKTKIGTTGINNSSLTLNLTSDNTQLESAFTLTNHSTLNIVDNGFLTIKGAINGDENNHGTLTISGGGNITLDGNIGETKNLAAVYVNTSSSLNAYTNSASINAGDIYMGQQASLIMGSGSLLGNIHGSGDDEISFIGDIAHQVSGNLGASNDESGIGTIKIQGTLANGANQINSNNFIFDSETATLNIGSGAVAISSFTNNNEGSGIINFTANNSMNFAISSDNQIAQLNVSDSTTVNANANFAAAQVTIGQGDSGKLILAAAKTITGDVLISSGANLTLENLSTVAGNISGEGSLEISANAIVNAAGDIGNSNNILGAVALLENSSLDLGSNDLMVSQLSFYGGSLLTIGSGAISGNLSSGGTINFTANNSMGNSVQIGNYGEGLAAINVINGANVAINNLFYAAQTNIGSSGAANTSLTFNNSSLEETTLETEVTLANLATFNINSASNFIMTGNINGDENSHGSLVLSGGGSLTLNGNIGNEARINNISIDGTLSNGANQVHANSLLFNSQVAVLNIGEGAFDIATFANNNSNYGIINFTANNSQNFEIYSENAVAEINIINGVTANINENAFADNVTIGQGESGKLILAAAKTITGAVKINSGANLTLENSAKISGDILGNSLQGSGTLEIAASATTEAGGNIGNGENKLDLLTLNSASRFNINNYNIFANNVSLGQNSSFTIGAGLLNSNISARENGDGSLTFAASRTLDRNIATSQSKLGTVVVASNATLATSDKAIYANNIALENNAVFELQNGGFVSNQINGSAAGYGALRASGAVSFNEIGTNYALQNITTAANSTVTFNNNIAASESININGNAIFTQSQTTITAASFNANSGSTLTFSLDLTSPSTSILDVVGSAMISANTTLNLTVTGAAASGSRLVLINASEASNIAQISESQININNSGLNSRDKQLYSTVVLGNQLLLKLRSFLPEVEVFSGDNTKNTYNVIVENADNATGELAIIKTYLENDEVSVAEKQAAIKSVSPQTDNSTNRITFDTITTTANIISARLESLYNNSGSVNNSGPSFAYNSNNFNLGGKYAWAQSLDALRGAGSKQSYPLSMALNEEQNDEKQAVWVQTFSSNINQNNINGADGYKSNSGGISIGMDCKKCLNFVIGASTTYAQSSISSKSLDKFLSIDSYQFNVYTGHQSEQYFLNTSLGASLNRNSSNRQIAAASKTARSNYDMQTYSARVELGTSYKFNELIFTPSVMFTGAHNSSHSYNKNGAGTLNLHVKIIAAISLKAELTPNLAVYLQPQIRKKSAHNLRFLMAMTSLAINKNPPPISSDKFPTSTAKALKWHKAA